MNQMAEDSITAMLNCFPQTAQNYELLLGTLERLLIGLSDQAIINAAMRYASGDVTGQSKTFGPSGPEFVEAARREQTNLDIAARPRIAAPKYIPGPLAPFQIAQQRALAENAHLPMLFEHVGFDDWRKLSSTKQVPVGGKWVACLGIVYGPEPKAA